MARVIQTTLVLALIAGAAGPFAAQATSQAPTPAAPKSSIIQKVIVKVNGEIFTQAELERMQVEMIRDRRYKGAPTQVNLTDPELASMLGDITPDLLVDAIDDLLFVQRGRELGAKFTDEIFKRALDDIKKRNNLDDKSLTVAMAQQGMTMEELRQQVERSFFSQHVENTELRVNLTEEEARQYYKAHPNEFVKPATVTVREITVTADSSAESQAKAQEKLKLIKDRLDKGEDFAALAKEVSDSPGKASGGLIESVDVGVIDPSFRAEIEKLQPKQVSAPIKTGDNYIMFQLQSKTTPEPLPLEDVRDQILQKIFNERMDVERKKHIEKLRSQALIEWKDDGYRQMYDRAMASRKTAKSGVRP
jgi:parvulin-like peptidyl-prolyl isomerase